MDKLSHNENDIITKIGKSESRGGRISSDAYRASLGLSDDFSGLEENVNRYDLLLLIKRVGKSAGFSPRMIGLLDYYMSFTREIDWEEGSRPIVFQSVARTSLDLGVSERQIQKLEKQLFELGAITWNDSGNHRRFGQRCEQTGAILYAYGVDLTPLAYLRSVLEEKLQEKQLYDDAWMETKRQISWYRRQILALHAESVEKRREQMSINGLMEAYEKISFSIRTYMKLEELRTLLESHKKIMEQLVSIIVETSSVRKLNPVKYTAKDEHKFVHYKLTNQKQSDKSEQCSFPDKSENKGFQKSCSKILDTSTANTELLANADTKLGLHHLTLKQLLNAASDRFRANIPLKSSPMVWEDVVEAGYRTKKDLGISQKSWGDACAVLGRSGAAVCVLLTDQAALREENPVLKPAAYFNSMVSRARAGELRLHNSVFGLLKRAGHDA